MLGIPGWDQQVLDLESGHELVFEADTIRYRYWVVIEGMACATVESVSIDLEPGQVIYVVPHSRASLKNTGARILRVLATTMEITKKKV